MKTKILRAFGAAILAAALYTFIAWMSGYDFDHRDEAVGFCALMGVIITCVAGLIGYLGPEFFS